MPLFIGLSTHNDTKHKSTAKRGVAGGLAALNSLGNLEIPGTIIDFAGDYFYLRGSGGALDILHISSNAYSVKQSGLWQNVMHNGLKDTAGNYAGLDAEAHLPYITIPIGNMEYHNGNGELDAPISKTEVGTATVAQDTTNYAIKADVGITSGNTAVWQHLQGKVLGSTPMIFQFELNNITIPASGTRNVQIGLHNSPYPNYTQHYCAIKYFVDGSVAFRCVAGGATTDVDISAHWYVGVFTIVALNSKVTLYKNGVQIAEITTNISTSAMYPSFVGYAGAGLSGSYYVSMRNLKYICPA